MGPPENSPTPPTPTIYSCFTHKQGRFVYLPRTAPSTPYHVILQSIAMNGSPRKRPYPTYPDVLPYPSYPDVLLVVYE